MIAQPKIQGRGHQEARHQRAVPRRRILAFFVALVAIIASTIAMLTPLASAEVVPNVSPTCPDGVVVVAEANDAVLCARPASLPGPDGPIPCPAGSDTAANLGIDESSVVGMNFQFSEGSCYYDPVCPAGYRLDRLLSSGPPPVFRVTTCAPEGPQYSFGASQEECAATAGAQWFPSSASCGMVITPPSIRDGVATPEQNCFAAGGSFDAASSSCVLSVWTTQGQPTPTIPPTDPTPMPTVVVDPTAAPVPTATPDVAPTATPVTPVVPIATVTPTPDHPGFGFTG